MDVIDNLIYTAYNSTGTPFTRAKLISDLIAPASSPAFLLANDVSFSETERDNFVHIQDPVFIEQSFEKHWYDIMDKPAAPAFPLPNPVPANSVFHYFNGLNPAIVVTRLDEYPIYQMIYAYLIENTRAAQIFERLISMYQNGEELGIANTHEKAFRWIMNTEYLFFKNSNTKQFRNVTSILRPNHEANRRNAYYRMFGLDLAFGDSLNTSTTAYNFSKAKASNITFILLFEQFLTEIWQAYVNARNTSGANSTDFENIVDLGRKIRELIKSRRGNSANYTTQNLSREEYNACFMMTWYHFILSFDNDLINFLGCQGANEGDRLSKIGIKVGLPAHSKCQSLFDMAGAAAYILKLIEDDSVTGTFNDATALFTIFSTLSSNPSLTPQLIYDLVLVINNWEKATGHRIKNPESNIRGTVTVAQPQRTNGKSVVTGV